MAALLGRLHDDVAGVFLPDNLVDEAVRDGNLVGRLYLETTEEVVLVHVLGHVGVDFDIAPEVVDRLLVDLFGLVVLERPPVVDTLFRGRVVG